MHIDKRFALGTDTEYSEKMATVLIKNTSLIVVKKKKDRLTCISLKTFTLFTYVQKDQNFS